MSVYALDGTEIVSVYDVDNNPLVQAYDVDGNELLGEPVPSDIVVMTYNYQWCKNLNSQLDMQEAIIDKYKADIIGLQEAGSSSASATLFPTIANQFLDDYSYKTLSDKATNRNGLASKIAVSNYQCIKYTNNDDENWDYQKCYIQVGGKTVAWYNTHLTYRSDAETLARKYTQAKELFDDAVLEDYAIITGDFNLYGIGFDSADYIGVGKQFADAGFHLANWNNRVGFVKTYTNLTMASSLEDFKESCDNIIVSHNIRFDKVVFDTTKLSYLNGQAIDHVPVIAYLTIIDETE